VCATRRVYKADGRSRFRWGAMRGCLCFLDIAHHPFYGLCGCESSGCPRPTAAQTSTRPQTTVPGAGWSCWALGLHSQSGLDQALIGVLGSKKRQPFFHLNAREPNTLFITLDDILMVTELRAQKTKQGKKKTHKMTVLGFKVSFSHRRHSNKRALLPSPILFFALFQRPPLL